MVKTIHFIDINYKTVKITVAFQIIVTSIAVLITIFHLLLPLFLT